MNRVFLPACGSGEVSKIDQAVTAGLQKSAGGQDDSTFLAGISILSGLLA